LTSYSRARAAEDFSMDPREWNSRLPARSEGRQLSESGQLLGGAFP
jgi:hypothetical protein